MPWELEISLLVLLRMMCLAVAAWRLKFPGRCPELMDNILCQVSHSLYHTHFVLFPVQQEPHLLCLQAKSHKP